MCVRVYNKDTSQNTDSPYTFADMLGISVNQLPIDNAYNKLIPDSCLCQVDIEKACEMFGYNYSENQDFDILISKKNVEKTIQDILKHR
jgi:hypothetical protein